MTSIEEIKAQMETLDDEKEKMSDGEYLEKANKLYELYQKVSKLQFEDDDNDIIISFQNLLINQSNGMIFILSIS